MMCKTLIAAADTIIILYCDKTCLWIVLSVVAISVHMRIRFRISGCFKLSLWLYIARTLESFKNLL